MKYQYASVGHAEDGSAKDTMPRRPNPKRAKFQFLILFMAAIASFSIGYIVHIYVSDVTGDWASSRAALSVPLRHVDKFFDLAEDFTKIPIANETELAWDYLLPVGPGVVKDKSLSPKTSMISAIHQLHCLYLLRQGFFSSSPINVEDFDPGVTPSTASTIFDKPSYATRIVH